MPGPIRRSLLPMLAGLAVPLHLRAQSPASWLPGLQLYTVRDQLRRDVDGTLRRVADLGYREVELAGLPGTTARAIVASLKRCNLAAPSMHAAYDTLHQDFASVRQEAFTLGATFVVCPSIDASVRQTADDWKRICQTLSRVGRSAGNHGLTLAYHNHDFEFAALADGTTPWQLMMGEIDPRDVKLELDVYWAAKAGLDPVQVLKDSQGRVLLVHLKDIAADGSTTELGRGVLKMEQIIRTALSAGVKHLFVEQDDSVDPLASIDTSLRFLQRLPPEAKPHQPPYR